MKLLDAGALARSMRVLGAGAARSQARRHLIDIIVGEMEWKIHLINKVRNDKNSHDMGSIMGIDAAMLHAAHGRSSFCCSLVTCVTLSFLLL